MAFNVEIHPIVIGEMESFTKPNCNLFIAECLTIIKKLCDKRFTLMNKNFDIYRDCQYKKTPHWFLLSTDEPVNRWKGYTVQRPFKH